MTARRIIILLLIWLIPLYPVLAGVAVHQPAPAHEIQMSQADSGSTHDCCNTTTASQSSDHSLKIGSGCDSGRCIAHCAISLLDTGVAAPVRIAFTHALPRITPLSSISLETPSRPPSRL